VERDPVAAEKSVHRGDVVAERNGYRVIACEECGYRHVDPLPEPAAVSRRYEDGYYESNPGWLAKEDSERGYWDLEHADKLADWSELLGQATGRLLDVGCASGMLLDHARAHGWEVTGIEPGGMAHEQALARGLTVHQGLYQDVELPEGSFDVVHSKLVFEHLHDPGHFVAWSRRLLSPGGILTVHAPNEFTSLQRAGRDAVGADDWWVAPPDHVNYWDFDSIQRLLQRSGLVPVGRDATFPVEWFLIMGEDYVHDPEVGRRIHAKRMRLERALEEVGLRRPLHALLAERGLGREAIVHARREDD